MTFDWTLFTFAFSAVAFFWWHKVVRPEWLSGDAFAYGFTLLFFAFIAALVVVGVVADLSHCDIGDMCPTPWADEVALSMLPLTPCSTCGPLANSIDEGRAPCRWEFVDWSDGGVELWDMCLICGHMNS